MSLPFEHVPTDGGFEKPTANRTKEINRVRRLREKFLTPEELTNLLNETTKSIRDNAIFVTAYYYAMRVSEVGMLQLEDFKEKENRIFIRRVKNGYSNSFALKEEVRKAIRKWLILRGQEPGALFTSRKSKSNIEGISKRQLDTMFKKYAQDAGLATNHRNFHTLRHTCAVNMVDIDIPMKQIQDWLGHTSIQSTLIYANVSSAKREETAERFFKSKETKEEKEKLRTKTNWKGDKVRKRKDVLVETPGPGNY